jgi:probable HAF family extracellular repeat protein
MKILGLLAIFVGMANCAPIYSVINLGNLGGPSSTGYQINNAGSAVGWAETVTGSQQAFTALPGGSLQSLANSNPGSDSYAYGINGEGVIVGTSYVNGQAHGTLWSGSSVTDLGAGVYAMGINDAGTIVGSNGHAFRMVNGVYQDLGTVAGGDWSAAYAVNDSGTAVGCSDLASGLMRAMIWNPDGSVVQLGTLGGANSYATDVNDSGEVVGHAATASGYEHAFLEIGGGMQDLGTLDGGSSYAYGINASGTIVGYSWGENDDNPSAFIYLGGVIQDLNSMIAGGSGWQLQEAYGINASGEIVGVGLLNGQSTAFLLDPSSVPEPRNVAVILTALALLGTFFRRCGMRYLIRRS